MHYLFVDNAYLRNEFDRQMAGMYETTPAIDYEQLAASLGASRTFVYDAVDQNQAAKETADQFQARVGTLEGLLNHVARLPNFHVREGWVRRSPKPRNREQKAVDVQLSVDAMENAARSNMRKATILAGDLDFEPVLTGLVRLGVKTEIVCSPKNASEDLLRAADECRFLTLQELYQWSERPFREAHKGIEVRRREDMPTDPPFERKSSGTWRGRDLQVFTMREGVPLSRLFVARGDYLSEPSLTLEYPGSAEATRRAFELSFGEITVGPRRLDAN